MGTVRPVPSAVTAAPVLTIAPSDARRAKRARLARTAQLSAAKDQCSDQRDHWHFIILTSAAWTLSHLVLKTVQLIHTFA